MLPIKNKSDRFNASSHSAILTIGGAVGCIAAVVTQQFTEARIVTLAIALTFLLCAIGCVLIGLENTQPGKRFHVWVFGAFLGVVFLRFCGRLF